MNLALMNSSGTQKQDPEGEGFKKHKTRYPKILYFTALVGFAMAAWILISKQIIVDRPGREPAIQSETSPTPLENPNRYNMLLGRWQRQDGGDVIEISRINADGTVQSAYYNPRPVRVAKAHLAVKESTVTIFIELKDADVSGATYSLIYDRQKDALNGVYHQSASDHRLDVSFRRIKEGTERKPTQIRIEDEQAE